MSKFQVNNDRSRDYTIPIHGTIQPPSILGQQPTGPMPGATGAPLYNGAQYPGPPPSGGWAAAGPPQHMPTQMPMQNYQYMQPGAPPPGPPGTMPPGSMPPDMGPGSMHMQNPNGLSQPPGMPPYSQ